MNKQRRGDYGNAPNTVPNPCAAPKLPKKPAGKPVKKLPK